MVDSAVGSELRAEIAAFRDTVGDNFKRDKAKAKYAGITTTALTGLATVVLVVELAGAWEQALVGVAAVLTSLATIANYWDRHFNHRALWVNSGVAMARLNELLSVMNVRGQEEGDPAVVDEWLAEYRTIRQDYWIEWRAIRRG